MTIAVIDTHAVIWYLFDDARLSAPAKETIDRAIEQGQNVGVSAISLVEIVYLEERSRVPIGTGNRVFSALEDAASVLQEIPVSADIARAMRRIDRSEIPDMPDRIIAATALHLSVPVISRDRKIQASDLKTVW